MASSSGSRVAPAPRFSGAAADGVVDEDAAHRLGCDAEEVRAVAPVNRVLVNEPQICFVDERGGLQGVAGPLARELARGDPLQLAIDERQQLVERRAVARLRLPEQSGHALSQLFSHLPKSAPRILNDSRPAAANAPMPSPEKFPPPDPSGPIFLRLVMRAHLPRPTRKPAGAWFASIISST